MYLDNMLSNNSTLPKHALELLLKGSIPPNTWVVDLDQVADNAKALALEAGRLGLVTYVMSKQHNRNPYINALAMNQGLGKIVAVDTQCALFAKRYNMPLGHAGHLNQIPRHFVSRVVAMRPDVITVYNLEHARWIDAAAGVLGVTQGILLRITNPADITFAGQEGGFAEGELAAAAGKLLNLHNIKITGLTGFPCVRYTRPGEPATLTANADSVMRAASLLASMGIEPTQINMPVNTSCIMMPLLKAKGATHVEPGNAILGTAPDHAFSANLREKTAVVYVSEISHRYGGLAYAFGGCDTYNDTYDDKPFGLVGPDWESAKKNKTAYLREIKQDIDYHMILEPASGQRCEPGDAAVFAFRTQMHMTRSYVAPVSGLSGKRSLKLHYLFDNACNALDADYNPIAPAQVLGDIKNLLASY